MRVMVGFFARARRSRFRHAPAAAVTTSGCVAARSVAGELHSRQLCVSSCATTASSTPVISAAVAHMRTASGPPTSTGSTSRICTPPSRIACARSRGACRCADTASGGAPARTLGTRPQDRRRDRRCRPASIAVPRHAAAERVCWNLRVELQCQLDVRSQCAAAASIATSRSTSASALSSTTRR